VNIKENIKSLGIPKSRRCPHCEKMIYRSVGERHNMADCMLANCKGLWCLEHCGHCGWVAKIYPTTINHIPCTQDECEKLFEEIKQYEEEVNL
jgi:hypothetical protein